MGKTTAETAFIVELGVVWHAQVIPGLQQEAHRIFGRLGGGLQSSWITRNHVDGVEAGDTRPTQQVAGNDVHLHQLVWLVGAQVRIEDRLRLFWFSRPGHPSRTQFALDARNAGQRSDPLLLEQGGYAPLLDGRVREDVSWENYFNYRELLER